MPRKKKVRSAEFKAKVAIAAVQEQKTAQQLAVLFDVHPTQVQVWKKQLLTSAASLFETRDRGQGAGSGSCRRGSGCPRGRSGAGGWRVSARATGSSGPAGLPRQTPHSVPVCYNSPPINSM